ncbi:MAG: 30S ribosomal protein S9 [Candidatus Woesebacteria bacterium GW2011_GWA1_45_8]|uniref:30S ribosomal protein S9 n=1 Tax=Candidatus Woesebacteria bacterium GW2011_GWA1_45_8 TaxID=1618559 RepID=A0A0G1MVX2_9BACT|nr:MAG: 30S ribosomal protein S9 [Candidatus Woesebacteria bacterium GW2011_GWA1_45_8]
MPKIKKTSYDYASGKRRTAVARVRLFNGKGENLVNGKAFGEYFPGEALRVLWSKPFELTQTSDKFYVTVKVVGGGKNGQLGAVVHAVAKALANKDPEKYRKALKKAGLLKRDSRIRQRRMVGTGGKARRQKQSPKR